jgi:hypothetical protein
MSGFSTTGASIIPDVSVLSTGFHFWRLHDSCIGVHALLDPQARPALLPLQCD